MPFSEMQMDLEAVIQSEVSQKERHKYHTISLKCGIQNAGTDEPTDKAEIETDIENKHRDTEGEARVG